MNKAFTTRQTATLLGVSESSVKRWVDRGRLHADRTAGGHRRIPLPELVRFAREEGVPLARPEMLGLGPAAAGHSQGHPEGNAEGFRQALMEGAAVRAQTLVLREYLEGRSVAQVVDGVMAPALRSVGVLWECREDGIFLEHRAVTICEEALEALRRILPPVPGAAPRAVGGGPEGDPYTLPSTLAATVLRAEGWLPVNLGPFTPVGVLVQAAVRERADLVWLAVSASKEPEAVLDLIRRLAGGLGEAGWAAPLVLGGPGCPVRPGAMPEGSYLIASMAELAAFVRGLRGLDAPAIGPAGPLPHTPDGEPGPSP
jgi:excisionase family DNA binding protein